MQIFEKVIFSDFIINNTTDMSKMFCGCSSLNEVVFFHFKAKNIIYMNNMFEECNSLKNKFF